MRQSMLLDLLELMKDLLLVKELEVNSSDGSIVVASKQENHCCDRSIDLLQLFEQIKRY